MGIPLVCGVGPCLSCGSNLNGRYGVCQKTAFADAERDVSAPQRTGTGLRVELWGRESASACMGGHLSILDREATDWDGRYSLPETRVPKAADEFHLVGEPER